MLIVKIIRVTNLNLLLYNLHAAIGLGNSTKLNYYKNTTLLIFLVLFVIEGLGLLVRELHFATLKLSQNYLCVSNPQIIV